MEFFTMRMMCRSTSGNPKCHAWEPPERLKCCEHLKCDILGFLMHSSHSLLDDSDAYGASLDVADYIILDFQCTRPQKSHGHKISFEQLGTKLTSDII